VPSTEFAVIIGRVTANAPAAVQPNPWKKRGLIALGAVIVLVGGFFFATQFLPRWWGHRAGDLVDGSLGWGVWWGLFFGVLSTVLPWLVARLAFHRPWTWKQRLCVIIAAVVLAAPNLMTGGIAWGGGSGAHAGERTMDVDAPGFRGATLIGVVIGLVFAIVLELVMQRRRRQRKELTRYQVEEKIRRAQ